MKTIFALASLVILAGCGSQSVAVHPNVSRAVHGQEVYAKVLVVGDEIVTSWGAYNTSPLWTFAGSPAGTQETTAQIAARLPALLAQNHYDVVIIEGGIFDMLDPAWDFPCGDMTYDTCNNLSLMAQDAHNAGAKAVFCSIPDTQDGSAGTPLLTEDPGLVGDEHEFNRAMSEGFTQVEDAVADVNGAVTGAQWTDDGLTFNATGAQLATAEATSIFDQLKGIWGAK